MGRWIVALGIMGLAAVSTPASPTPAQKCTATKVKTAGRAVLTKSKCSAKAVASGVDVDPACLAKADLKLAAGFTKAEASGGCDVVGDVSTVRSAVATCLANFTVTIAGDSKCAAAKTKAVGKEAFAEAKCRQKAVLAGASSPDSACTAKAEAKLATAVAKADGYGICTDTAPALETSATTCVASAFAVIAATGPCSLQPDGFGGTCGGTCDAGLVCLWDHMNGVCACTAPTADCSQVSPPNCPDPSRRCLRPVDSCGPIGGGMCGCFGPTSSSTSSSTTSTSSSTSTTTSSTTTTSIPSGACSLQPDGFGGTCGGTCAPGLFCLWDRMNGTCACVSALADCSQLSPPNCPDPSRLCPRPVDDCGPVGGGSCGCFGPTSTSTSTTSTSTSSTTSTSTTSTSSTTSTTVISGPCSLQPDGLGGTCGGACSAGLACLWDRMNGTCACVSALADCSQLSPPNCPDPSRLCPRPADDCGPIGNGMCGCSGPTTSSTSSSSTSSSTSSTTSTSTSSSTTSTVASGCTFQADAQGGTCGGPCDPGLVCLWDHMNATCACVSVVQDCSQLAPPNCPDSSRLCPRPSQGCGSIGGGHCGCQ